MDIRQLGKTVLQVPVIGMGTWKTFNVRGVEAEAERQLIVKTAFESDSIFYDTSPMYGEAERVLGAAVLSLGLRDKVQIATKVWTESDEESEQQLTKALEYFGGYVDLYQVHNLVAWQKRLIRLEELKTEGKVRAVGITHYSHAAYNDIAQIMRTGRVEAIQIPYNVLDREVEKVILPLAESLNIGIVVMRPFGAGHLLQMTPPASTLSRYAEYGVKTWAQILLKWIASDPRVSVIIPATSVATRMAENAVAGTGPWFDAETRDEITRLADKYCR
jgi:aryl-alcohol dehydrogenase-like predicted oxidoreductase